MSSHLANRLKGALLLTIKTPPRLLSCLLFTDQTGTIPASAVRSEALTSGYGSGLDLRLNFMSCCGIGPLVHDPYWLDVRLDDHVEVGFTEQGILLFFISAHGKAHLHTPVLPPGGDKLHHQAFATFSYNWLCTLFPQLCSLQLLSASPSRRP